MFERSQIGAAAWRGTAMLAAGALIAGCSGANKTASTAASSSSTTTGSSSGMAGMNMAAGTATSGSSIAANGHQAGPHAGAGVDDLAGDEDHGARRPPRCRS